MSASLPHDTLEKLSKKGLSSDKLDAYHDILSKGYPYIKLAQNCRLGAEIQDLNPEEKTHYRKIYAERKGIKVLKFVPASGAASRMFKDLFTFLDTGKESEAVKSFFDKLEVFPFSKPLQEILSMPKDMPLNDSVTRLDIVKALLLEEGMNYVNLPKGLIKFHRYGDGHARTAFEEHYHEAALYAMSGNEAHLHFTIPDQTQVEVQQHLKGLTEWLSKELNVDFRIATSLQKPSTDTPAIYADDHSWALQENGDLLLRPAGHGALLENLNDLDADLVFIKNIDNVVPDHLKTPTVEYKEVIAGMLLEVQKQIFGFLRSLDEGKPDREQCSAFFKKWFHKDIQTLSDEEIRALLDRPLRICGMVKNEGEPGGGPFVVDDGDGKHSLQIVEKAQVNTEDPEQLKLLNGASHFNPVDLVVSLKNHNGEKYDLLKYRNPDTGMVVSKTHMGRDIYALELPGLWNGSMHHWNTIFVEVPIETFNPVKTVFDLLRPAHQGS